MRRAAAITIPDADREVLLRWSRGRSTPARLVLRAKIVLAAATGKENKLIAHELGTLPKVVGKWRARYAKDGLSGIEKDAPRGAPERTVRGQPIEQEVVRKTTQTTPKNGTHWSTRTMAEECGISPESVRRIWHRHGLRPHLVRTFKLSRDPAFTEKLEDIVGLYLNPPENAVVFCADEKSQIQALDRTQPGLPLKKGRAGTMTHDYKRNGTTTLFAAMCMLTGYVISTCMPKHRHQEWLKFLKMIDETVQAGLTIHVIADNYSTHKHPKVQRWLRAHPRVHMHFTPTSSSWLNLVERFFRGLTEKRIRRGTFPSVEALVEAIEKYIEHHNGSPEPFVWTKTAPEILAKVVRARQAIGDKAPSA
jgi:transposase